METAASTPSFHSTSRANDAGSSRVVVASVENDLFEWGVLQCGHNFGATVPLKLSGIKADPTRFRVSVKDRSKVPGCALLKCSSGAVGRVMAGVSIPLCLELTAAHPGQFDFRIIICSEVCQRCFIIPAFAAHYFM